MGEDGEPIGHWLTRTTLLDGAYCNALPFVYWSVCQKIKPCQFNLVQFSYVALHTRL